MSVCTEGGCDKAVYCRGLCSMHYDRLRRSGQMPRLPSSLPPIERLMERVEHTAGPLGSPCWVPTYSKGKNGYATMQVGHNKTRQCHRVAYETLVGPVPVGLELDHLCRNRGCCNPEHLEPVTHRENMLRGNHPSAIAMRTNKCCHGHPLVDSPLRSDGSRRCLTCHSEKQRRYYAANRSRKSSKQKDN